MKKKFVLILTLAIMVSLTLYCKVSASTPTVKRLAGSDRYLTSLKVAQDGWSSSYYAVLACGEDYPDALSSVPLAKKYDAPILLTHRTYIDSSVITELQNLDVGKVFVIGGTASVNDSILKKLNSIGIQTERIGGIDRYDTSVKIAEKFGKISTLTVATGQDYADALSISTAAAAMGVPVILVPKNIIPESTKEYINTLNTTINSEYSSAGNSENSGQFKNIKVFVVGDSDIISDNVVREFENTFMDKVDDQQFGNVERIPGKDKYERNINVISRFLEKSEGKGDYNNSSDLFSLNNLYVASGDGFADALSGAAEAVKTKSPVILSGASNSQLIKDFILTKISNNNFDSKVPEYITVLGGQGVVPDSRVNDIIGDVFGDKNVTSGDSSTSGFKDSKLEKLIRDKLGINTGTINYSDLKGITSLDLSNQGITDISGLENCVNLTSLDLSYNEISSVKPLLRLYNLKNLNLSHNKISDISYLSNLSSLNELDLSNNDIDDLAHSRKDTKDTDDTDYDKTSDSVFKKMTSLTSLNLSNSDESEGYSYRNSIYNSDIDNLKYLTALVSLNLAGTNVSSISNLEKCTSLNTLDLSNTDITSLSSLDKLTKLTYLDLSDNHNIDGDDLKPLKNLLSLKYLDLSNDDIDNLKYLSGLVNLKTLYLEDNPILDYTPILSYEKSIYYRDFDVNSISDDAVYSNDSVIDSQIKSQISNMATFYNYGNYDKLRLRILYRSYDTGVYNKMLGELKSQLSWLQDRAALSGISSSEREQIDQDIQNAQNQIVDIDKKNDMNLKVKNLENQILSTYDAKNMEKIINQINYIYSDYRYDYYRTLVQRDSNDIQYIKAQIQILGLQGPGYGNSSSIDNLQYILQQKQKEENFAKEKITMYDNYRNFFNAVNAILQQI